MLELIIGIIMGIWLSQNYTLPKIQNIFNYLLEYITVFMAKSRVQNQQPTSNVVSAS